MSACRKNTKDNLQLNEKLKDFKMKKKTCFVLEMGSKGKAMMEKFESLDMETQLKILRCDPISWA